jgi:NAD-specific glutamate dehydrogenase
VRERYAGEMENHPLRREIVVTALVNEAVNRGGISWVFRTVEETGSTAADVLRSYAVVRDVFDLPALWAAVEALDNQVPTEAQTSIYLEARRLMDRASRWLVQSRRSPMDVPGEIDRLRPGVAELMPRLATLFLGDERESLLAHARRLAEGGVPADLAEWGTRILHSFGLLDVVEVSIASGKPLDEVAGTYFVLSERFRVDELLSRIGETDERIVAIDSRRKIVDEVQQKANTIVHLLDDVRINLETLGEQKAVIDHVAEKSAQLEFMLQEARNTLRTLQHERELAERIEQGIKKLRAAPAGDDKRIATA